MFLHICL